MTSENAAGAGPKAKVIGAGIIVLGLMAGLVWKLNSTEPPPLAANLAAVPAQPVAEGDAAAAPTETTGQAEALPAFGIEVWRVDSEGAGLVAGNAPAGAEVSVFVDGALISKATAIDANSYVVMFTLPPNENASLMTLTAVLKDGTELPSPEAIALAPIAGPVTVAAAEPTPEAAPDAVGAAENTAEPPATLLLTEGGAKPSPAEATKLAEAAAKAGQVASVVVSTISYTPEGAVLLAGTGQPDLAVRLYLDNALVAEAAVQPDATWQTVLADTPAGIYTLRADQVDQDGKVSARFETPFKRETLQSLAALSQGSAPAETAAETAATAAETPAVEPAPVEPAPEPTTAKVASTAPAASPEAPAGAEVVALQPAPAALPAATQAPAEPLAAASPTEPAGDMTPAEVQRAVSITVQPGYSLWRIARDTYGEGILYVQVYDANKEKIRNPDLIYPGQIFLLPPQE